MVDRIKRLMNENNLNVHQLAKRSGINRARLSVILMADDPNISEDEIQRFALAFRVDRSAIEMDKGHWENRLDERIRWHLTILDRMDLFQQVQNGLREQVRGYRQRDYDSIRDDVILAFIHNILDNEESGA